MRSFQLFAAQTLPAGSITASVRIWMLPLLNTWMTSPGFRRPRDGPSYRHRPLTRRSDRMSWATQTSSLPSGRIMFTMPVVIFGLAKRVCIM